VQSAGRRRAGANCGKTWSQFKAREMWSQIKAWKTVEPMQRLRKRKATARENGEAVHGTGSDTTSAKRAKTWSPRGKVNVTNVKRAIKEVRNYPWVWYSIFCPVKQSHFTNPCCIVSSVSSSVEDGVKELTNVLNSLPQSVVRVMEYLFSFLSL